MPEPIEENLHAFSLKNGLRVIIKTEPSKITHCGLVIDTGSRDEFEHEWGMAHFTEHMLFKGTAKRRSVHIINRLEHVGGELNAFTSKEETVIYASILKEYTERALELIADICLHSVFPQNEIDKEIDIVLDEIQSYNDSPSELIYDDFEELMFANHALAHNILGNRDTLQSFNTSKVSDFVNRTYLPQQMVLFVTGNDNLKQLQKWIEKYFGTDHLDTEKIIRLQPTSFNPECIEKHKQTHQVHYVLGGLCFDLYHPDRLAMYLLNNLLGGPGMNSKLNMSLREKHGLVYTVESSFQPFTDSGTWSVYFGCDPKYATKCRQLVLTELDKFRNDLIPESVLRKYKLQLIGQLAISSENKENQALGLAKSYLRYNKADSIDYVRQKIQLVSSTLLRDIACEIYKPDHITELIYK